MQCYKYIIMTLTRFYRILKSNTRNSVTVKYKKDFWNSKTEHFWTWNQILVPNKDSLFNFKYNIWGFIPVLDNPKFIVLWVSSFRAIANHQNTVIQVFAAAVWFIIDAYESNIQCGDEKLQVTGGRNLPSQNSVLCHKFQMRLKFICQKIVMADKKSNSTH